MGKRVSLEFELTDRAFQLSADGFHPERSANGDFWRAFLDTSEIRELSVYSHAQTPKSVVRREDGMMTVSPLKTAST